jgi:hypothetical protein
VQTAGIMTFGRSPGLTPSPVISCPVEFPAGKGKVSVTWTETTLRLDDAKRQQLSLDSEHIELGLSFQEETLDGNRGINQGEVISEGSYCMCFITMVKNRLRLRCFLRPDRVIVRPSVTII